MSQSLASRVHRDTPFPAMKQYILTERLGAGTYATVYKGHRKVDSYGYFIGYTENTVHVIFCRICLM